MKLSLSRRSGCLELGRGLRNELPAGWSSLGRPISGSGFSVARVHRDMGPNRGTYRHVQSRMFNPCQNHHHTSSLPPSVDTTPFCTRADAHFSRACITVHNSRIDPHFSNVGAHRIGSKEKGICVAHFSALISISFVMSLSDGPLGRFPLVTSSPTCSLSRLSVLNLVW